MTVKDILTITGGNTRFTWKIGRGDINGIYKIRKRNN